MKKLVIGGVAAATTALALAGAASAHADNPAPPAPVSEVPAPEGPLWTSPLVVYNGDYDDGDEDLIIVPVL